MAHVSDLIASRHRASTCTSTRAQKPVALHHVRPRGRRKKHPDRPVVSMNRRCCSKTSSPQLKQTRKKFRHPRRKHRLSPCSWMAWPQSANRASRSNVAYRFFSTDRRKFIVADTPGHEAVHPQHGHRSLHRRCCRCLMVDARKGILTQTRRHSYLVSLILGIRHIVVAINKMDLVDYSGKKPSTGSS